MGTTHQFNRGVVKTAVLMLTPANAGIGNAATAKLPQGAIVTDVKFATEKVFNGTAAVTGTVTDGTTTFVNAQDLTSAGMETVAVAAKAYPAGGKISAYITDGTTTASTAGSAAVVISYVEKTSSNDIYE